MTEKQRRFVHKVWLPLLVQNGITEQEARDYIAHAIVEVRRVPKRDRNLITTGHWTDNQLVYALGG